MQQGLLDLDKGEPFLWKGRIKDDGLLMMNRLLMVDCGGWIVEGGLWRMDC